MTSYVVPGLSQIAFMYTAYTSYPSVLNAFTNTPIPPLKVIEGMLQPHFKKLVI